MDWPTAACPLRPAGVGAVGHGWHVRARDNLGGTEVGQVVLPATPGGSPAA